MYHPVEAHQSPEAPFPHKEEVPLVGQGRRLIRAVGSVAASTVIRVLKRKKKERDLNTLVGTVIFTPATRLSNESS